VRPYSLPRLLLATTSPLIALVAPALGQQAPQTQVAASDSSAVTVVGYREKGKTEGTGSYTTDNTNSATKLDLSLRETPQSISVLTRALLDDFNIKSANDALSNATGVFVQKVETDRTYYSVRGFDISNFQLDGVGLPFATGDQTGDMDIAFYDRVEVLRGANGLTSSTGNPSATINFVRKRPTDDFQASATASYGSWDNKRLEADVSTPLNEAGTVRGRFSAFVQDRDSYLDRNGLKKTGYYGVVEADLAEGTLLTVGHQRQANESQSPLWGALPLYFTDGTPTSYSRSTSTSAEGAFWNSNDTQSFVELRQELGAGWVAKASFTRRVLDNDGDLFYIYGTPDKATGLGLYAYPSYYYGSENQLMADANVSGPVELGGRTHQLLLGASWSRSHSRLHSDYYADIGAALPDLATWNGIFNGSGIIASTNTGDFVDRRQTAYAAGRFELADPVHVIIGGNVTRAQSKGSSYDVAHDYDHTEFVPYIGATYDLDANYSLYSSYAEIFNPQSSVDVNNKVLDPIKGSNLELGVKGEWFDKKLNATAAIFRTKQQNTAEYAGYSLEFLQSYYAPVDATSEGFEFDLSGEVLPGWQVGAGYTQMQIEDKSGHDARLYVPRKLARLSTSYDLPAVPGLTLGGNLSWQSAVSRDEGVAIIRQDSFALLNLMAQYQVNDNWTITATLNNVTDKKYLTSLYWSQSYYGAPRNGMVSVNWKF
jgi:outer membrane receptor for ferric coprogen and ferric-rhodotorulic acid